MIQSNQSSRKGTKEELNMMKQYQMNFRSLKSTKSPGGPKESEITKTR